MSEDWITDSDGWTRREVDGRLSYVRCSCCDLPVYRSKVGLCEECISGIAECGAADG